jgi:cholesterol oxidase
LEREYDAVVVGSGFGGGIAACRLAAAGWRVCVLERGRRWGVADFPEHPEDAPGAIWHPTANPKGLYEIRIMRDVATITCSGVGGGSLIYANVQLRAPAEVFASGWPAAITREELDPFYDRTEEALLPRPTPPDPPLDKARAFDAMAAAAGRSSRRLPLAVHFGEEREHPFSGVRQSGCDNLGLCIFGCPLHAKNTVDITYLARAERDGAEVYPLHEVARIEPPEKAGGRWEVGFEDRGGGGKGTVSASTLVLGAGALGSTRLLLRNRRRLPALSQDALGSRFSGNGDALGMAFDPKNPEVAGGREDFGPSMTSAVDYTDDRQLIAADGGLPTDWSFLLEIIRGYNAITGWRRQLLRLKSVAAVLGFSDRPVHPRELGLADGRPITDTFVFLMFGRDAADGRMRLTPLFRRFDISWSKEGSRRLFDDMRRTTDELARAAQAQPFFALDAGPLGKFLTVHPLGGCPMGDDPGTSVVDHRGRAHGYDSLVVTDGAAVPTALGVNPSKTIAALAERSVSHLIEERTP